MDALDVLERALITMGPKYLKKEYRDSWTEDNPAYGYCYVVSEMIYHMALKMGIKLQPFIVKVDDNTHWFLKNSEAKIFDFTKEQYDHDIDYSDAKPHAFLTKKMSKRAKTMFDITIDILKKEKEEEEEKC